MIWTIVPLDLGMLPWDCISAGLMIEYLVMYVSGPEESR